MDADGKSPRTLLIIGKEIASWRRNHGYTQATFAQAVGIPKRTIEDLEQGRRLAKFEETYILKPFMGVDDDFFATSEMRRRKRAMIDGHLDRKVDEVCNQIHEWNESTPYCEEKEKDLGTLKGLVDMMISKCVNALLGCHDPDLSCCREIARISVMECSL